MSSDAVELHRKGLAANEAGDSRRALDLFLHANRLCERAPHLLSAANMQLKLQQPAEALELYRQAEKLKLTEAQASMLRAKISKARSILSEQESAADDARWPDDAKWLEDWFANGLLPCCAMRTRGAPDALSALDAAASLFGATMPEPSTAGCSWTEEEEALAHDVVRACPGALHHLPVELLLGFVRTYPDGTPSERRQTTVDDGIQPLTIPGPHTSARSLAWLPDHGAGRSTMCVRRSHGAPRCRTTSTACCAPRHSAVRSSRGSTRPVLWAPTKRAELW
jgi:hypothetical protein